MRAAFVSLTLILSAVCLPGLAWSQARLGRLPNTDLRGLDYKNFDLSVALPEICLAACAKDPKCFAYTYVKPGIQGPKARCWLKSGTPIARSNSCCVSGFKTASFETRIEPSTDRPGADYRDFDLSSAVPEARRHEVCLAECAKDPRCVAYTYVRPGIQGPNSRCWLKSSVSASRNASCCVSGVKKSPEDRKAAKPDSQTAFRKSGAGIGSVINAIKTLYTIYKALVPYWTEAGPSLTDLISAAVDEILNRIDEEVISDHRGRIAGLVETFEDLVDLKRQLEMSTDGPGTEDERDLWIFLLGEFLRDSADAVNLLAEDIALRDSRFAYAVAEAYNIIVPLRAVVMREANLSQENIDDELRTAVEINSNVLFEKVSQHVRIESCPRHDTGTGVFDPFPECYLRDDVLETLEHANGLLMAAVDHYIQTTYNMKYADIVPLLDHEKRVWMVWHPPAPERLDHRVRVKPIGSVRSWGWALSSQQAWDKPMGVGDVNGDGICDMVIINGEGGIRALITPPGGGQLGDWYIGNPHQKWGWALTSQQSWDKPLGVGDVNGDGRADVLIINGEGEMRAILTPAPGGEIGARYLGNPREKWGWALTSQQNWDKPLGVWKNNVVIINGEGDIRTVQIPPRNGELSSRYLCNPHEKWGWALASQQSWDLPLMVAEGKQDWSGPYLFIVNGDGEIRVVSFRRGTCGELLWGRLGEYDYLAEFSSKQNQVKPFMPFGWWDQWW